MNKNDNADGEGLNRRQLLNGALAGTAALACGAAAAAPARDIPQRWDLEVDLLSLGSSCGGLLGAIVARDAGLSAAVLETTDTLGGGTARSNGGMWIPLTDHQAALGLPDDRDTVLRYIRATSFGRHDEAKLAVYVDRGPETVRYLNTSTQMKTVGSLGGDYYENLPDSRLGRQVWPDLRAGAALFAQAARYPLLAHVGKPPFHMAVGGQSGITDDFGGGNALIGGLVASCADRNVPILLRHRAQRLIVRDGRVIGVEAERDGKPFFIHARRAVLIATGGFEADAEMNRQFAPIPGPVFPMTAQSNRGDGHRMAMEIGAAVAMMDAAVWIPALLTPGAPVWGIGTAPGGAAAVAVPGTIFVNRGGRRVCDESFYPAAPQAMFAGAPTKDSYRENFPLFWLMDSAAYARFGLGPLRPGSAEVPPWLCRADTLEGVASRFGIDAAQLKTTVARFNGFVEQGRDTDFGRGDDRANPIIREQRARVTRLKGEEETESYMKVAQLAPLLKPPFYAAELGIGSVGHRGGLVTSPDGEVMTVRGAAIPGLYAASNAAAQLAVGYGYSSGQSIALSLIGGYVAGRHIGEKAKASAA